MSEYFIVFVVMCMFVMTIINTIMYFLQDDFSGYLERLESGMVTLCIVVALGMLNGW